MTAAFAAYDTDLVNGFIEYRSESWAIGADPTAVTTFNYFNVRLPLMNLYLLRSSQAVL